MAHFSSEMSCLLMEKQKQQTDEKSRFYLETAPRKNDANIEKHGLDFVDVVLVFQDSYARIEYDPKHSEGEERYRITGSIKGISVVVVIFTDRNNVTRIISARRATRQEVKDYERRF